MSLLKEIADKIEALEAENEKLKHKTSWASLEERIAELEAENEKLKEKQWNRANYDKICVFGLPGENLGSIVERLVTQNTDLKKRLDESYEGNADDHNRAVAAEHELATMRKDAVRLRWLLDDSEKKRKSAEYARDQFAGNAKDAYTALNQSRAFNAELKKKADDSESKRKSAEKELQGLQGSVLALRDTLCGMKI